ncbi:MAG: GNAT family N-acetyltransferase [Simkaniaceae bacterium]|nr:GNAT family N-acetyltransferase [Candidatus Sacchlamyda saccharinae]
MSATVYEIKHAESEAEILGCFDLLRILRPHLERESFVEKVRMQKEEGYTLIFISDDEGAKSVAGFRVANFLAWGKVLYVDDLITLPEARGIGFGTHLLKHLKGVAKEHGCNGIHLDTGVERDDAHRLYLNLGMHINCLHLSMDLE